MNPQCVKPQFKYNEVEPYGQRIILQAVHKADLLYCTEDEMAKSIRIDLNNKLGGHWHVVVGRHFARFVWFKTNYVVSPGRGVYPSIYL